MIPPDYARWLATHNVADSGGRPLPAWGVQGALSVTINHGDAAGLFPG